MSQGGRLHPRPDFLERLEQAWLWDGSALPPALQAAVRREEERWRLVDQQIRALEAEQAPRLEEAALPWHHQIAPLMPLRGIGLTSAWVFGMESFGWRQCTNRQEVAAIAGLTPMPYASGDSYREQGMSKAGANAGCRGPNLSHHGQEPMCYHGDTKPRARPGKQRLTRQKRSSVDRR